MFSRCASLNGQAQLQTCTQTCTSSRVPFAGMAGVALPVLLLPGFVLRGIALRCAAPGVDHVVPAHVGEIGGSGGEGLAREVKPLDRVPAQASDPLGKAHDSSRGPCTGQCASLGGGWGDQRLDHPVATELRCKLSNPRVSELLL